MSYFIEMRKIAFTATYFDGLWSMPHMHTHLELVYIKEGRSEVVVDNKRYIMEAGDLFLAFPNQIHYYFDQTPVKGYFLIFAPEIFREFKDIFQMKAPVNPILQGKSIPLDIWECLCKVEEKLKTGISVDGIVAKGYLLTLLGEMFARMELVDKPGDQETMKRILSYCIENYTEPLTLENLAKELYLNKYYVSHIFRERMNISYKDFINQLRVEHACEQLKKDVSITEIAYASGFSSVRTFNRVFLKYMNMTPRDYIKQKQFLN